MIKISKQNNSLIVEGIDNVFYPNNGDNSYPLNSLIVVTDNSDMATFRSVATNDVLFSGLIQNITINGEAVTKDNIIQKFDAVSNSSTGGGGGSTVDAYTKEEADNKFSTKDELASVQTVANDADTKVDALTTRVESVETTLGNKQDTLVSGANIKTINNQSILGEGNIEISDYYTKTEADEIFATTTQVNHQAADISALQTAMDGKQATLVSGENIKTINGESVLGEGNIEVAKKTDIPSTDNLATKDELTAVETVANNADTKADAATSRIESVETAMGNKQDTLVSGTNIKTVNSQSILGEGNIEVSGVSEEQAQEIAKIPTLETELSQKANVSDVPTVQINHDGTNKNYIYSSYSDRNCSVYSKFYFRSYANSMVMEGHLWGKDQSWIQNFQIPLVTTSKAGVMTAADKTKLDSIPENIPSQSEIDGIAANVSALQTAMDGKQATLVSGENIKTINSESILGTGDIQISSEAKIYDAEEIGSTFNQNLNDCVIHLNTGEDYKKGLLISSNDRTIYDNFFHNIKYGDIVLIGKTAINQYSLEYRGVNEGYYRFAVLLNKYDNLKNFTADISLRYTQNSEYITFATNNGGPAAKISDVMAKQDTLVSGTNIKTINGNSILGEGNLVIEGGGIDLSNYYNKTEVDTKLDAKQNNLVSGTNIKTINGESVLGEGNLEVTIPDATTATSGAMSAADKTKLDSISNEWTGTQAEYDALTTKDNNIIYYVTE